MLTLAERLLQDVRYALRQVRKTPTFTLVAILTLALGIGANTAVFSVMNAVLLRALPVRDPQQLVYLHTSDFPGGGGQTGYGDTSMRMQVYEALRQEKRVFSGLMAWVPLGIGKVAVRYGAQPEEAQGDMVSGNFFSGLGVPAVRGRTFTMDDETNHTQSVVLSFDYWSRRFGRDPSVIGQAFYVKGVPFTIVGVAARNFVGLDRGSSSDFWVPFQISDDIRPWGVSSQDPRNKLYGSQWWFLLTIGRLAPDVSEKQAIAYLTPIFQRAAFVEATPPAAGDKPPLLTFTDTRGMEGMRDDYRQPLRILMGMVGLVLLIACGNVAMLLLARNAARQREFSLRMALGGSRLRLFSQMLTESLLLVAGGALLGWFFAVWATRALATWSLLDRSLAPDKTVLAFTLGIAALAAVIFGLAPLRSVVSIPIGLALKTSGSTTFQDRGKHRNGQIVVALQMSLCLVLLVGAGLLVRTLRNLETLDLGLKPQGLLVFGVNPQQHVHNDAEAFHFYQALLQRLQALPGVESATVMRQRIGGGWSSNTSAYVDGRKPVPPDGAWASMRWNAVGPNFFHVVGTPLLVGRDISDADSAAGSVVVVNQTFAKKYLPDTTPLGHHVAFDDRPGSPQYSIVGVAADSKYTEVRENPRPMAYFPYTQVRNISAMHVEVRVAGDPAAFLPVVQRAMFDFAPDLPLLQPMTQREQLDETLSQDRLFARLASFFGLLAVVLVATGLYGTLAYRVARRTAEIGVRMALGAQRYQVLWMVLRESLVLCVIGLALGLPAAVAGARLLRAMLFGLKPLDPLTFTAALLGVTAIALLAGFVPARRASSVNPTVALRCE